MADRLRVAYTVRDPDDGDRLLVCHERDLVTLLLSAIKPKGIGLLKTEAQVEKAIRAGIREAFEALREGR